MNYDNEGLSSKELTNIKNGEKDKIAMWLPTFSEKEQKNLK